MFQKGKIVLILKPIFDMEGERQKVKNLFTSIRIVLGHCLK